jgi:polyhydroxyalkanoate synthesis regulator phasin
VSLVRDALKNYLTLASGVTAITRQRALETARQLVSQGEATASQVQTIASDLVATSRSNRESLVGLVRYEVDRGLGRLGLATADEVASLRKRIRTLEAAQRGAQPSARTTKRTAAAKKTTGGRKRTASTRTKKAAPPKRAAPSRKAGSTRASRTTSSGAKKTGAARTKRTPQTRSRKSTTRSRRAS